MGTIGMHITFAGRRVIVTGAAQGIGRGIAAGFADAGAHVFAFDRDADGLAAVAARAETRALDLGDRAAVLGTVAGVGPVDVLVNCAGGVRGQVARPVEEVPEDDWRVIFQANVDAAFHCAQAVAPASVSKAKAKTREREAVDMLGS
jgi:3-oxoacyl-[acyl-carrier protein] reductase